MEVSIKRFQEKLMLFFVLYLFGIGPLLHIFGMVHIMPVIPQSIFLLIPIGLIFFTRHRFFSRSEILFLCLIFYIFFYSLFNYEVLESVVGSFVAIRYTFFGSLYPLVLFLLFRQAKLWQLMLNSKKILTGLWTYLSIQYIVLAAYGMHLVGQGGGLLSLSLRYLVKYLHDSGQVDSNIGYQAIGDGYVFLTIFLLCIFRSQISKILVFVISLYILYVVGSRASLIFFVVTLVIAKIAELRFYKSEVITALLAIILLCAGVGAFSMAKSDALNNVIYHPVFKLMVGFVLEPERDESFVARKALSEINTSVLMKSDFLGTYRFEVREGRPGTYTHNIVSILEEYGLFAFALLLLTYGAALLQLLLNKNIHPITRYALYMMIFVATNMFLVRAYDSILLWLAVVLGVVSVARETCTQSNNNTVEFNS
ncbi:MAG: hypothetical protein LLG02_10205 [Pelosinus sp.]|nr:hypothetical protein [Pelosinus sp.]